MERPPYGPSDPYRPANPYGQPAYRPSGGYPPPPPGHPYGAPQVTNSKAVASLVFGILGWILIPLLGSVIAVVLGNMARTEIRNDPYQTGDGMAVAGLVLGWIAIGLALLVAVIVLVILTIFAAAFSEASSIAL